MARTVLLDETGVTTTNTFKSKMIGLIGDFAAFLVVKNADRGSANELYDAKIQESPDPMEGEPNGVSDLNATWFDLITFTQIADTTGQEKKTQTAPRAARLRVILTLAGTTPSADYKIVLEDNLSA